MRKNIDNKKKLVATLGICILLTVIAVYSVTAGKPSAPEIVDVWDYREVFRYYYSWDTDTYTCILPSPAEGKTHYITGIWFSGVNSQAQVYLEVKPGTSPENRIMHAHLGYLYNPDQLFWSSGSGAPIKIGPGEELWIDYTNWGSSYPFTLTITGFDL